MTPTLTDRRSISETSSPSTGLPGRLSGWWKERRRESGVTGWSSQWKPLAYGVASVSGTLLAVCSCTVLPLFGGIYANGAGLGPASAFLYAGPAINVLAIVLTASVLGVEIGVARAVGAVVFALVIGLVMHLIFRRSEMERSAGWMAGPEADDDGRPLWQSAVFFGAMVGVLVFANWGAPDASEGFWYLVYAAKWKLTAVSALVLAYGLVRWIGMRANGSTPRGTSPSRSSRSSSSGSSSPASSWAVRATRG